MTRTMCLHSTASTESPLSSLAVSTPAVMRVIRPSAMSLHLHGHIKKRAWAALPAVKRGLSRLRVRRVGAAFLFCCSRRLNNSIILKPKASRGVKRTNTHSLCSTFLRLHSLGPINRGLSVLRSASIHTSITFIMCQNGAERVGMTLTHFILTNKYKEPNSNHVAPVTVSYEFFQQLWGQSALF